MFPETIELLLARSREDRWNCLSTPKFPQRGCRVALDGQIRIDKPRDEIGRRGGIAANSQTDDGGLTDTWALVR